MLSYEDEQFWRNYIDRLQQLHIQAMNVFDVTQIKQTLIYIVQLKQHKQSEMLAKAEIILKDVA